MNHMPLRSISYFITFSFLLLMLNAPTNLLRAQVSESTQKENGLLFHGIEQYQQGHYNLAAATLETYLKEKPDPVNVHAEGVVDANQQKGRYYYVLSRIKNNDEKGILVAGSQFSTWVNPFYKSHIAYNLGQYYFRKGKLREAIHFYEQADIAYLDNEEIADKKFELAYSYFNNQQFDKAKLLFAAIKDLPKNKYYIPGNYYYGLLAYNDQNYKEALESFKRIDKEPSYKDVVPYYEAEIYYFTGEHEKVLSLSEKYLRKDSLYYTQDMELLTAQTLFEQKKYEEALPYFEEYYNNSDKIRKEELYELAYCYYRLKKWPQAIERFQPLSNAKDSLGQTSMYLLGDCYLKVNDKKGARNAFEICANMNFNPSQTEAASFLYAKLSDELGFESSAIQTFNSFINQYPNSTFTPEAKTLLSQLLAKSSNYAEAFRIMSDLPSKDDAAWQLYQRVAVGNALQELQNNHLKTADSILTLSLQQPVSQSYAAVAYFWKSEIAYRQGNYEEANKHGQSFLDRNSGNQTEIKAISNTATSQNARMIMGYSQMKLGDYSNAQQAFAQAKKENGNNPAAAASATLHEADAYFMQRDFSKAKQLYKDAIAKGIKKSDYARYQLAHIEGLSGNNASKKQILSELISKNPPSPYQPEARYELALTQLNDGELATSITGFEALMNNAAAPEKLKSKSLIKLAYAYQLNGNNEKAIDKYEQFLKAYPADTSRDMALGALRSIYIAAGTPEQYEQFIKENNLPDPDEETLENTFYDAAIQDFGNENWKNAVEGFSKYLNRFPNGNNAVKAHFYRGISYEKTNRPQAAVYDFDSVLVRGWSEFSADAASSAARISFTEGAYNDAYKYYGQLRDVTTDPKMLQIAYEGLMKCSFELTRYDQSAAYADTLLSLPSLPKNVSGQANLYKARSLQKNNYPDEALSIFQKLDKENLGAVSAEARYRIAEISFGKGDYKAAEKQAGYAAQASAGQEYWTVKCYILLGDILTEEKDYFNAKATLSSIVKNTKITSLKKEASEKLEKVKALEKANSKLQEN